jgi:hypothetical protein
VVDAVPNREELYMLGDFNAKVGGVKSEGMGRGMRPVGRFAKGDKASENGEALVEWAEERSMVLANTHFRKKAGRSATW